MKTSTMLKIYNVVKGPLRFLKEYGIIILLLIAIGILIYICQTL